MESLLNLEIEGFSSVGKKAGEWEAALGVTTETISTVN